MDKYSRQIGAFGLEAMSKLMNLKVLIVGLRGLGVETAKNLILAGPGAVTLCDDDPVELPDLGANFFLEEGDKGKPRASCVADKLQELNSMVNVKVASGELTEEVVGAHSVVVMCGRPGEEVSRWNAFCHEQGSIFISAATMGVYGFIFSDFGKGFSVRDLNGEAPVSRIVTNVSSEEEAVITLLGAYGEDGGRMHGMEENEHDGWIELSDVEGMVSTDGSDRSINDVGRVKIKTCTKKVTVTEEKNGEKVKREKDVFDPFRLKIPVDTRAMSAYENGGMMTQVKVPVTKSYLPLEKRLIQPVPEGEFGMLFTDGSKFGRGELLHMGLLGLRAFERREKRLPEPGNPEEAEEVVKLAEEANAEHKKLNEAEEGTALFLEEIDKDVLRQVALYASVEVQPLAAYFGGVVAQEVVKVAGKYTPLNQWLHLDFLEMLPEEFPEDGRRKPGDGEGDRYEHVVQLFGEKFFREKIMNAKTFMVGCGALGCEFLKNFALVGLACGEDGKITVTDNDRIEVSNLNRQFLFREHNVGQPKSAAAAAAAKAMNSSIKLDAREDFVSPGTENLFPDAFWEGLNFVTNALDNVKARLYVDSRCVFYGKPLLESGTLGTKCNVQVVVPHVTASYADGPKDQADDAIPMCTLRNFPSLIEHCIEWARAQFEDMFVGPFAEAKKFCDDKEAYLKKVRDATIDCPNRGKAASATAKALEELGRLKETILLAKGVTFEKCVREAASRFRALFRDRVLQLVHNFPEDHETETGEKFWTGAKRFPRAAHLNVADQQHTSFVLSSANLLAAACGLTPQEKGLLPKEHPQRDVEKVKAVVEVINVPAWQPTGEKIDLSEGDEAKAPDSAKEEPATDVEGASTELEKLLDELSAVDVSSLHFEPADFEKDQDLNFHVDFVTATSNMRAWNYRIKEASRHKVKMIAGKIIPAIATTTASVSGLVMIELFKILQGKKLESYKDSSNNLGLNSYFFSEPAPPEKAKDEFDPIALEEVKCVPSGFTKWDRTWIDRGNLTLGEFLEAFKDVTGLNCSLLFHHVSEIDGPQKGRMLYDSEPWNQKLKDLYANAMGKNLTDWVQERFKDAPSGPVIPEGRCYVELQVSCVNDDGDSCKVPSVVYRWKH
ncbi:unnamed protein product [Ascophyllum nodosum]